MLFNIDIIYKLTLLLDRYKYGLIPQSNMKTRPLPKWIMQHYAQMWYNFKEKEFTYEEVSSLFKNENKNSIRAIISQLRKNGWLMADFNQEDSRKRTYKLKSPIIAIENMVK